MFKMTFILCAALYVGFIVLGNPDDRFVELDDEPILSIRAAQAAPSYDRPTILSDDRQLAAVTRALPAAPDPSIIAASAPAAGFSDPARIGEPVVVSLVHDSLLDDPIGDPAIAAVETVEPSEGPLLRVTGTRVNMRSGPSVGNPVVDSLAEGTLAEAVGEAIDGWIQIRDISTGQTGFMSANFLEPV